MSLRDSHSACGKTDSRGGRGLDGVWRAESQSRSDMSYGHEHLENVHHDDLHPVHSTGVNLTRLSP